MAQKLPPQVVLDTLFEEAYRHFYEYRDVVDQLPRSINYCTLPADSANHAVDFLLRPADPSVDGPLTLNRVRKALNKELGSLPKTATRQEVIHCLARYLNARLEGTPGVLEELSIRSHRATLDLRVEQSKQLWV